MIYNVGVVINFNPFYTVSCTPVYEIVKLDQYDGESKGVYVESGTDVSPQMARCIAYYNVNVE